MNQRKEDVLLIAYNLVEKDGFDHLTMRRLAKEAGISIGSVYNLFESKDQLTMFVIQRYWTAAINNIVSESENDNRSFIKKLEYLYTQFQSVTKEFHQDWLQDLVKIQMSNPQVAEMSSYYKMALEKHIQQMIVDDSSLHAQLDQELTAQRLAAFIFDNMMLQLQQDAPTLGTLKIVLVKLFDL